MVVILGKHRPLWFIRLLEMLYMQAVVDYWRRYWRCYFSAFLSIWYYDLNIVIDINFVFACFCAWHNLFVAIGHACSLLFCLIVVVRLLITLPTILWHNILYILYVWYSHKFCRFWSFPCHSSSWSWLHVVELLDSIRWQGNRYIPLSIGSLNVNDHMSNF
jgi:hypothetical protein